MIKDKFFLKCIMIILVLGYSNAAISQVGIGTTTPNSSAMLDISNNSKGLLIPRMTDAQRAAISFPATGLLVYQTDGTPGFYYNSGTPGLPDWVLLLNTTSVTGYWSQTGNDIYNLNSGNVGVGTTTPNSSAILDISNNSKGLLIPRMTAAQRAAISFPATGLLVYQTDGTPGFYYNSGTPGLTDWTSLVASTGQIGTVTSVATGTGLTGGPITTSGSISAQNTTALWNANQLQGIGVSAITPLNGQVLQYNGTNWIGTTSSGANSTLSNLSATSVSQSLIPINSGTLDLGSGPFSWNSLWLTGELNISTTANVRPIQAVINSTTNSNAIAVLQTNGIGRGLSLENSNSSNPNSLMYLSNAGTGKWIDAAGNAYLSSGGTNWVNSSDIAAKDNITSVDGRSLLTKISQLPITQWSYKSDNGKIKHIGPMAQDFYTLFGVGNDDKSISTIDPSGIALACIKELSGTVEQLKAEVSTLRKEMERLQQNKKPN